MITVDGKNSRPLFCTLCNIGNEMKEKATIPYGMSEYCGYDSMIATYMKGEYPIMKLIPGVRLEDVPRISGNWVKDSCSWLRKNAGRIDVLNIYILDRTAFFQALTYKLHNPKGKVYLRLEGWPTRKMSNFWKLIFHKMTLKMSYLVSTEYKENVEMLSRDWHREIMYSCCPLNPNEIKDFRPYSERSNVIFTVGRLGTKQKATEILLEAFARVSDKIPSWTLKLTGRIMENTGLADDFYARHPELRERVNFTGPVMDRNEMTELYMDAKIFAFPSRWESFCVTVNEAMMLGCFPVTTDILGSRSATCGFKYGLGSEVDDIDGMAANLLHACTNEAECERLAFEGRKAVIEALDLRRCCEDIAEGLS